MFSAGPFYMWGGRQNSWEGWHMRTTGWKPIANETIQNMYFTQFYLFNACIYDFLIFVNNKAKIDKIIGVKVFWAAALVPRSSAPGWTTCRHAKIDIYYLDLPGIRWFYATNCVVIFLVTLLLF